MVLIARRAQAKSIDPDTKEVLVFLAKTLIAWGVPVVSIGVVAFFVLSAASRGRREESSVFLRRRPPLLASFLKNDQKTRYGQRLHMPVTWF